MSAEPVQDAARRLFARAIRDGYKVEALHCYADANGDAVFYRARLGHADKPKLIRPLHLNGQGWTLGEPAAPAVGKLLYRLPELLMADAGALVHIVEGEKCADALAAIGIIATTSGSASSADGADWTPLRGRRVRLWPDHDRAGAKYADAVRAKLEALGCAVDVLDVSGLGLPDAGDCVDWLAAHAGATANDVAALPWRSVTASADGGTVPADWRVAVERLAKLAPLEYERVRKAEAGVLGIERLSVLDDEVKRARCGAEPEAGTGRALVFPDVEPWPDAVTGADVLSEIAGLCKRFLQLPKHGDTVVALWTALTYCTEAFDCLPMLFITAPEKGCGKSTVLDLVQRLCALPLPASNITPAALFRTVELARPTLLLDEADSFLRDNEDMRGILNSGHTRSAAFVIRVVGDDHEPRTFSTWCPKALAGIGRLPGTIEDRALIVTMQRLAPGEHVEKLRREHQYPDLCRKLTRWANDHLGALRAARPSLPDRLHNRAADNWEPLFAVAAAAGGDWPARVLEASAGLSGGDVAHSVGTELLRDIRAVFIATSEDKLATARLIELLAADDAARWADYNHGRPLTGPQLAKLLKRYSVAPGNLRIGESVVKGYKLAQFEDVFTRYLPAQPGNSGFSAATPLQRSNDGPSSDFSSRYTNENVAAAKSPETRANTALWRCSGSETGNPTTDTK